LFVFGSYFWFSNEKLVQKLSIHHSRDSPLKQWSESRVLAMKGLLRLLRSCARIIVMQAWFLDVWERQLQLCVDSILSSVSTLEQATSGVDLFFGLLQLTSDGLGDMTDELGSLAGIEGAEKKKLELWSRCLKFLPTISQCTTRYCDLVVVMCQKLLKLYKVKKDAEFRYSENLQLLIWSIVAVARPLRQISRNERYSSDLQINRSILELIRAISTNDRNTMGVFLSSLMEITLTLKSLTVKSSKLAESVEVSCVSPNLRTEVRTLLWELFNNRSEDHKERSMLSNSLAIDILCKQFLSTLCRSQLGVLGSRVREEMLKWALLPAQAVLLDNITVIPASTVRCRTILLFIFHHDLVSLFNDSLEMANKSWDLNNASSDSESRLVLSLAFLFAPWSDDELSHSDMTSEVTTKEFRSLLANTVRNDR
jgi:hypothetical protein